MMFHSTASTFSRATPCVSCATPKTTLRACLIAGLMRGEQERTELAFRFKEVCQEQIVCPGIVDLFTMDNFDGSTAAAMREAMEQNVAADSDFTLEYYISHVLYLSRRA